MYPLLPAIKSNDMNILCDHGSSRKCCFWKCLLTHKRLNLNLSLTLNNKTFHSQSECMSLISVCEEDWPDKVEWVQGLCGLHNDFHASISEKVRPCDQEKRKRRRTTMIKRKRWRKRGRNRKRKRKRGGRRGQKRKRRGFWTVAFYKVCRKLQNFRFPEFSVLT